MTDFGFTIRDSKDSRPNLHIMGMDKRYDPRYELGNKLLPGYDIAYFMVTLDILITTKSDKYKETRDILRQSNVYKLLDDFADIVSEATGVQRSAERTFRDLYNDGSWRPKPVLSNLHFEKLLESSYFDEVLQ
jgi:hypothetical protein